MPTLAVFASSSQDLRPELVASARDCCEALAAAGWDLVYGGANVGLMDVAARAFRAAERTVISVIPRTFADRGLTFSDSTEVLYTDDLRERKRLMAERAQAFLALPGGPGTLDEFADVLTAKMVGLTMAPLVLFDPQDQWRHLIALFKEMREQGFAYRLPLESFCHARSVAEALAALPVAEMKPKPYPLGTAIGDQVAGPFMTQTFQQARDLVDSWPGGRPDLRLLRELAEFISTDNLSRLFWLLRDRPGATERRELLERFADLAHQELSPLRLALLDPSASGEVGLQDSSPNKVQAAAGSLDRKFWLNHLALAARQLGDLDLARSHEVLITEELAATADPFMAHLLARRRIEDALDHKLVSQARIGIEAIHEGIDDFPGGGLLQPGIDLLRARLQEIEDDPECLWSYLSLSRDFKLLESDREEATFRAAEVMSQRRRLAGALALQLELVHGPVGLPIRTKALMALVRDMVRGSDAGAALSHAESLLEIVGTAGLAAAEALALASLAAIRSGDALSALDYADRAASEGADPAILGLTRTLEALERGETAEAINTAEEVLKQPATEDRTGPWRGLLALERLRALKRSDRDFNELVRAAEMALREAAHARDAETLSDAYFGLAVLLAERPESRERAVAACREAESLTRNLIEAIDADRELLFKIMPRDNVIRTVVSSLMGRLTEHARRGIAQLLELGATLAREAERGRDLLDALRSSQRRVSRLLEALPIVIWTAWGKRRNFALSSVAGAVEPLFGRSAEALETNPNVWLELIHQTDRPQVIEALTAAEGQLEGRSVEFRFSGADAEPRWAELHVRPILGDPYDDGILHGIISDVSERRILHDNIQRVQKLEGLGRLAGGVTHDFNNLLGSILGAATLLLETTSQSNNHYELLQVIEKAAVRGSELVANLRGFTKTDSDSAEVVNLGALVRETVELGRGLLRREIEVHFEGPETSIWVACSKATLTQIVLELMRNADEARPSDQSIHLRVFGTATEATLQVRDAGQGMDYETRNRAIDPFFSTKDAREHRGLGLTMVYKALSALNGRISLQSEIGQGTEVTVVLPIVAAPVRNTEVVNRDIVGRLAEGRILLIDDDPEILRVSEMILSRAGFEVVIARDGREGLERFLDSPGDWTLVVTDVRMPRWDGISVAREIRGFGPTPPILLMTGFADDYPASILQSLTSVALIQKPFTASAFIDAAGGLLQGAQ